MRKSRLKAIFIITVWLLAFVFEWGAGFDTQLRFSSAWADPKKDTSTAKVPVAVFPEPTYDFQPITEGTEIKHDFVIKNRGRAPLVIESVEPDCSCSVASTPGPIPAGGKDKISVVINTDEKGGGVALTKRFKVTTNDTKAAMTELTVSGKVIALVKVLPWKVDIAGYKGDDLSRQVRIIPATDQLFTIKNIMAANGGKDISWDLKPLGKEPSKNGYMLTVSCKKLDKGRSNDILIMQTDLKGRPTIRIPVYCNVFEKPTKDENKPAQ